MTASIIRRGEPRYNAVFYDLDRGTTRSLRLGEARKLRKAS